MKKAIGLFCVAVLSLALLGTGCAGKKKTTVTVFAAASLTETMTDLGQKYMAAHGDVELVFNFDSSGTLRTQIDEGAEADLFFSAGKKQIKDLPVEESTPLLVNTVVLIVPKNSTTSIHDFPGVMGEEIRLVAIGNSDVPVGQYTQEIYTTLGLWDSLVGAGKVSYGSNVKEVLSQVASGAVDCGIVYKTDAAAETGVRVVATAPENTYSPAVYPCVLLTKNQAAADFYRYLQSDEAMAVFASAGFTKQ